MKERINVAAVSFPSRLRAEVGNGLPKAVMFRQRLMWLNQFTNRKMSIIYCIKILFIKKSEGGRYSIRIF